MTENTQRTMSVFCCKEIKDAVQKILDAARRSVTSCSTISSRWFLSEKHHIVSERYHEVLSFNKGKDTVMFIISNK